MTESYQPDETLITSYSIAPATIKDLEELLLIKNDALQYKLSHGDEAWERQPFTLQEIREGLERGNTYLVSVEGKAAGTVTLTWNDEYNWGEKGTDGNAGYIHNLAISNGFRGRQLGRLITEWCGRETLSRKRSLLRLDCPAANIGLCEYYEKLGFVRAGLNAHNEALYERVI